VELTLPGLFIKYSYKWKIRKRLRFTDRFGFGYGTFDGNRKYRSSHRVDKYWPTFGLEAKSRKPRISRAGVVISIQSRILNGDKISIFKPSYGKWRFLSWAKFQIDLCTIGYLVMISEDSVFRMCLVCLGLVWAIGSRFRKFKLREKKIDEVYSHS